MRQEQIYAALLHAYSPAFRTQFGVEARLVFADCLRAAQRQGPGAVVCLWARTLADLVITAAIDRFSHGGPMIRRIAFPVALLALAPALLFWTVAAIHAFSVRFGFGDPLAGALGLPHFGPLGPARPAFVAAAYMILLSPGVALLLLLASMLQVGARVESGRIRLALESRWLGWGDVTLLLVTCAIGGLTLAWLLPHAVIGT